MKRSPTKAQRHKPDHTHRVIHTADWHMGKLLGEQSRYEEHEQFLAFLLQVIGDYAVDTLVIAGDVFDSANPPQSAVAQYYNFLSQLFKQGGCSVIITGGNHDSPGHLNAPKEILKAMGAHVIGSLPEDIGEALIPLPNANDPQLVVAAIPFLRDRDLRIGMSGQSAKEIQQALVDGIANRYAEAAQAAQPYLAKGIPVMATGHLTVVGSMVSDSEREIHVGGLGAVGARCFPEAFAYVALGHLHRPQCAGRMEHVRYAGSPIPLSFSEATDTKAIRLLDFSNGKLAHHVDLEVPLTRPLKQLHATRATMCDVLNAFQPAESPFPTWVELIIEDPVQGENLAEEARNCAAGRPFEIIRLLSQRPNTMAEISGDDHEHDGDINALLEDPAKVFQMRLLQEAALTGTEQDELTTAFGELLNLFHERSTDA